MSANDELDPNEASSVDARDVSTPANLAAPMDSDICDDPGIDVHSLNVAPGEEGPTTQVKVVHEGRAEPLPYPDIWGDEDYEPIDVHSLNVVPGKELFKFTATLHYLGKIEPLPYPDPLGGRDEEVDD
jgi:hypothetical protein